MKTKWLEGWGESFPILAILYIAAFTCALYGNRGIEAQAIGATLNMMVALWIILYKPPLQGLMRS